MPGAAPRIQRARVRRAFDHAAPTFAANDFLYREMSRRMDERLDIVRITPERILDAGCALGADRLGLHTRYPAATWIGLDQSARMLQQGRAEEQAAQSFMRRLFSPARRSQSGRIVATMDRLPLTGQCVDLVWSNGALHWVENLPAVFNEFNRVLRVGGLLMFSTFGPDTLRELRQAIRVSGDLSKRIHDFTDMHDIGDMLVHAGFSDPVMDMETLMLTYADPWQALHELKRAGSIAADPSIVSGLTTRSFWTRACAHWPRDAQGRYPLTFELIQGHAWKVAPRQHEDGRAIVNFMPRPDQPRTL